MTTLNVETASKTEHYNQYQIFNEIDKISTIWINFSRYITCCNSVVSAKEIKEFVNLMGHWISKSIH